MTTPSIATTGADFVSAIDPCIIFAVVICFVGVCSLAIPFCALVRIIDRKKARDSARIYSKPASSPGGNGR